MTDRVLAIDQEKCTGCRTCETVCSAFHTGTSDPDRSRIRILKWDHIGFYLPVSCQNCDDAICTEVCPAGACRKDADLQVAVIDDKLCIGCKTCVLACPFGVPKFDKVQGVSIKCDYCGGDPECVKSCTTGALSFVSKDMANSLRLSDLSRRMIEAQSAHTEEGRLHR